jgi:uridine kinase
MTSLPLDNVNRVSASDIRLLRRIVRDRYTRGITAESNIMRWPSVRRGEIKHIFPYQHLADAFFNTSLVYELAVLKVYAERYLLEVPEDSPAQPISFRLRRLIDKIVAIYPEYVPPTSILREFVGGSSFKY